jgi:hypothetical protein
MNCDSCGQQIRINWGDAATVLCKSCYESEATPDASHSRERAYVASQSGPPDAAMTVRFFGVALIICGLLCAAYFALIYDTSIQARSDGVYVPGTGRIGEVDMRVHNLGLLQNRQTGIIGGIGVAILGGVLLLYRPTKPNSPPNDSSSGC